MDTKEPMIPQALKDIAKSFGCNVINYVTFTKDGNVFSLAKTNSNGEYEPIGLPILYAVKGSSIIRLDENQVYEILSNIK